MALETFLIDAVYSTVGFTVRHLVMSKVHGLFTKWNGALSFDEESPAAAHVEVEIDVASVDTRDPERDAYLRTSEVFEAKKFPTMTFKSTSVDVNSRQRFKVTGELTLRGVTKPVVLDVEYGGRTNHQERGERIRFSAHTRINRKDFGVGFNQVLDSGGVAVGEKVDITIEVEAMRASG